jgi:hypothetical protein
MRIAVIGGGPGGTDWHEGGNDVEEAGAIAQAFAEHGADGVDVSTGQVVAAERPAFERSYALRRPDPQRGRAHARGRADRGRRDLVVG